MKESSKKLNFERPKEEDQMIEEDVVNHVPKSRDIRSYFK